MPATLVIIGLGYVGLPLAQEAVRSGLDVTGLDRSERVTEGLMAGRSHVDDLSDDDVGDLLARGFRATTDINVVSDADNVVICVPTPLSAEGGPDLTAVLSAADDIAANLRPGTLVVLESTTYPGTTETVLREHLEVSGLVAGRDFSLAFSPERIDPGNPTFGFRNTPKVVGGLTEDCAARAAEFYRLLVDDVVVAKGAKEAEMAKLLENTYRHVNIALVNEMARFCHDLDIDLWDVIRCAATKPFGFQAFYPGPGVGGHCIPIDPNYLSYAVRARLGYPFRFVELAQEINQGMPAYVVGRVQGLLNDRSLALRGSTVLLVGVTYKANIADERESPAVPLARLLVAGGARVAYHDPLVPTWTPAGERLQSATDPVAAAASADLVVLMQPHRGLELAAIAAAAPALLDTRGTAPEAAGVQRL